MSNLRKHLMESGKAWSGLVQAYRAAARRGLLLDYDGTMVPFVEDPKLARPDAEVMDLLRGLKEEPGAREKHAARRGRAPSVSAVFGEAARRRDSGTVAGARETMKGLVV